mgnify:CR=1 FL=1
MEQMKPNAKTFFRFAAPSVVSMIMFSLYTMVDGIFLAHANGEYAFAAINLAMPFINGIFALGILFAMGTSTVVAITLGQGDTKRANEIFTQNIYVLAAVGLVVTVLVQCFTRELALFLGATENTVGLVVEYLRAVSPFTVCFIVGYGLEVLVKTGGHPSVSLVGISACCGINIVLDAVLVVGRGLGMAGAGVATGIAQTAAMAIFLSHFLSGKSNLRLVRLKKPFLGIYKRILALGLSDFSGEVSLAAVVFLFNHLSFKVLGESGVVIYAAIAYLNNFVLMIMTGVSQGMQPLVSLSYGAGDEQGCRRFYSLAMRTILAASLVCFAACRFLTEPITALMLDPAGAVFPSAVRAVQTFSYSFLLVGFNLASAAFLNATARPAGALAISLGRGIVLIAAAAFVMSALFGGTGLWLAATASEAACLIVTAVLIGLTLRKKTGLPVMAEALRARE